MLDPLPVEVDFHSLDTHQRLEVVYRFLLRFSKTMEDFMSEAKREAGEQVAKTKELTDAVNAGFGRFVGMVNDRDAVIATQAEEIARLRGIEAEDVETAAILDNSQTEIDSVIADVNTKGLPAAVPTSDEPAPDSPLGRRRGKNR